MVEIGVEDDRILEHYARERTVAVTDIQQHGREAPRARVEVEVQTHDQATSASRSYNQPGTQHHHEKRIKRYEREVRREAINGSEDLETK